MADKKKGKTPVKPQVQVKGKGRKRTVDKWKKKIGYTIYASPEFDKKEINETLATKPDQLLGRVLIMSARDVLNEPRKQHMALQFRINNVQGTKAYTEFLGFDVKSAFMKKFVRRNSSKMESVQTLATKDTIKIVVKCVAITSKKVDVPKEKAIRKIMYETLASESRRMTFENFLGDALFGELTQKVIQNAKHIANLKRVDITKALKQ
jgi:ribosomal protein S3AE